DVDGLFIAIGRKPDTEPLKGILSLDEMGYIITDENMNTNIAGVYAAGDVRHKTLRQIITACADGAIASVSVNNYLLNVQ
ncbi:MAG: FAD-dependent oxidoreductase, partial [Clostridia bacterium]|nr:FAD-dependent oxidoreductase [Clostridia bacterium]